MGINLVIGDKVIPLNESQVNLTGLEFNSEQSKIIREQFQWDLITEMTVSNINNYKFYVKDYQRGYRWTASEVEALLDDIAEVNNEKYCMQPLVIRKSKEQNYNKVLNKEYRKENGKGDVFYEVIDGQQRLTTILLILNFCEADINYSIYYEQFRNVDEKYMEKAKEAIEDWFKRNKQEKKTICKTIKENLFFVWYLIGENKNDESSEKIFNTVNSGKVELTNAELFRALLLKSDKNSTEKNQIEQIAFEWDIIEQNLKNNEFWYFIAGDENNETTRIDYILELYARVKSDMQESQSKSNAYNDERFSFNTVKKEIQNGANPFEVWKEIVEIYERLYSWYSDDSLYHLIGFLVCCEEDKKKKNKKLTSNVVYDLYKRDEDKIALQKELWARAKKEIYGGNSKSEDTNYSKKTAENYIDKIENVRYGDYTNRVLRAIFLYFNVWTYMQSGTCGRFSFFSYKTEKWDIEHINPQNLNIEFKENTSLEEKKNYISFLEEYANCLENADSSEDKHLGRILNEHLSKKNDSNHNEIWKNCVKKINENGMENNIKNLTLLNSGINRSYGNAFFSEKRKEIISNDEKGVFIPACTKNVFLKYYSQDNINAIAWTSEDKNAYFNKLNECFIELKNMEE